MERIIITFNKDGSFRGSSAQDFDGQPKPLDEAGLKAVAPSINEAALAEIVRLESEHTKERDDLTAQVETLTSERDGLLAQVESLTAQIESMTKAQEVIELAPITPQPIPAYGVSKLSIMRRLGDKWPTLKAALATLPETVQDSWTLALGISADDPLFIEFRPQLLTILEMTEEEFDTLLTP
jgi:hypothetical protein